MLKIFYEDVTICLQHNSMQQNIEIMYDEKYHNKWIYMIITVKLDIFEGQNFAKATFRTN
jgi:hypothetical protein